jgi:hypothetical protein
MTVRPAAPVSRQADHNEVRTHLVQLRVSSPYLAMTRALKFSTATSLTATSRLSNFCPSGWISQTNGILRGTPPGGHPPESSGVRQRSLLAASPGLGLRCAPRGTRRAAADRATGARPVWNTTREPSSGLPRALAADANVAAGVDRHLDLVAIGIDQS